MGCGCGGWVVLSAAVDLPRCLGESGDERTGERSRMRDEVGDTGDGDEAEAVGSAARVREREEDRADLSGATFEADVGEDGAAGGAVTEVGGMERLVVVGDGEDSSAGPWLVGTARCCDSDGTAGTCDCCCSVDPGGSSAPASVSVIVGGCEKEPLADDGAVLASKGAIVNVVALMVEWWVVLGRCLMGSGMLVD